MATVIAAIGLVLLYIGVAALRRYCKKLAWKRRG